MSVQEIEIAMQSLSIDDLAKLSERAVELYHTRWDKQIADDLDSGRLDALLNELDAEYDRGKTKPL